MHNEWEELIPFYVAGSLSKGETTRLENHLTRCAECSKSVESWRSIAGAVRDQAASQMRALPPLSPQVTRIARRQAAALEYEAVSQLATRRVNSPITLIAAVFTVILFGGLLTFFVLRSFPRESEFVALLPTATVTTIPAKLGSPSPEPQIIVIEPSNTPVPTKGGATPAPFTPAPPTAAQPPTVIVINPTQQIFPTFVLPTSTPTFEPPVISGMGGGNSQTDMMGIAPAPTDIEGQAESSLRSVQPDATQTEPTPIPPIVDSPLVLIPNNGINLRGGPGTDYLLVGTARSGESYHVEAQQTRQGRVWYRLTVPGASPAWVSASLVELSPRNATIPPAGTIPPTPGASTPAAAAGAQTLPVMAGRWSEVINVSASSCGGAGESSSVPVTLEVSFDAITLSSADSGTFTLSRSGEGTYAGGYATADGSVSVVLLFDSAIHYTGSATTAQNDGCTVMATWNGEYTGA